MRSHAGLALSIVLGLACGLMGGEAAAEAAYSTFEETVARAEVIAIVHTELVEPAEIHGEFWMYQERVVARVVTTIKGDATGRIEIAAKKNFICAPVRYEAGADYLVFLAHDAGHLATVNHGMGALRIDDDLVEWPYTPLVHLRPLVGVEAQLRALLSEAEPPAPTTNEDAASTSSLPAPVWMAAGGFAVLLGAATATRRKRNR